MTATKRWSRGVSILAVTSSCSSVRDDVELDGGLFGDATTADDTGAADDGATGPSDGESAADADPSEGAGNDGHVFDVGDSGIEDSGDGTCECIGSMDGIHLLSSEPALWFFDPLTLEFDSIGAFACDTQAQVNSMAVDRQGRAWINFWTFDIADPFHPTTKGELHVVDLSDPANCEKSAYTAPPGRFAQVGMGFASESEADACDDLYLFEANESAPRALGRVDRDTLEVAEIGGVVPSRAELTGTGDGRLFAFAQGGAGAVLIRYDKETAAELESMPLPGLALTNAFAFAFWGGDFWFFTESGGASGTSKVTRLDYDGNDGGGLDVVVAAAPATFGGAGVSTCVSIVPPG